VRIAAEADSGGAPDRREPWEVIVIGAGPAGSTAARGLAQRGLRVLLLDRAHFPRHKVCGSCLGPTGLARLRQEGLGHVVDGLGARSLTTLDLRSGRRRAEVELQRNRAVLRSGLDAALVEEAVAAGVVFRDGCSARIVGRRDPWVEIQTRGDVLRARAVVDAAGLSGTPLARPRSARRTDAGGGGTDHRAPMEPGARVTPGARIGIGAVFGCGEGPPPGVLRMVVGRDGYVGSVRCADGSITIAAAIAPDAVADRGPAGATEALLAETGLGLPTGQLLHPWKGTARLTRGHVRLGGAGVLRIGDAAGYVEPFTGEGIGWAIGSGVTVRPFVERAVRGWTEDLASEWTREHRRVIGTSQRTCAGLAGALRQQWLVRLTVAALARAPGLARPLVRATSAAPRLSDAGRGAVSA
jgi:2-polyprenyl-6-methoxyphenol hydroxylase-like FAD-dependent oxidoreductase